MAHTARNTVHCTRVRWTVWKKSDARHGAFHDVKCASQGSGAARVVRVAHHLALVTRGQVRAIWRQHRRIRCGHVNALLFLAHGVRRHLVTFQLARGEAGGLSVVGRLKADCTSCVTRGAVCDIFTILVLQRSHARPEPTDAERPMRLAQAWGVLGAQTGDIVLSRSPESAAGRADQTVEVKLTGDKENVVFGQIRPSKVSPRCVASNQCTEARVGPASWTASVARNVRGELTWQCSTEQRTDHATALRESIVRN